MNTTPESQTVGATPKVVANRTIALYDPQDGRIVHMHQVLTLEGARQLDPQQYEREARKHAPAAGAPGTTVTRLAHTRFSSERTRAPRRFGEEGPHRRACQGRKV